MDLGVHLEDDQPMSDNNVLNTLREAGELYDFIMHIVSKLFVFISVKIGIDSVN